MLGSVVERQYKALENANFNTQTADCGTSEGEPRERERERERIEYRIFSIVELHHTAILFYKS